MNNNYRYSAVDLLRTVIEFTRMTPNPDDWSFKAQMYNDPRFIRLQRIQSFLIAFIPEIGYKDEREAMEKFYSGEFIRFRKSEDYRELTDLMHNTILKSDFGNGPRREINLDALQFNYEDLLSFYSRMNRLGYNGGIMEISYPYFFSYIVTKSISDSMMLKVQELEEILSLFIDPFHQTFTLEELIGKFDYPEEDLIDTDIDWK